MSGAYQTQAARPDAAATVADNVPRLGAGDAGRYEVWYLTLSHLESRTGFWIRYTIHADAAGPSTGSPPAPDGSRTTAKLWFAAFHADEPRRNVALHRRFAAGAFATSAAPFAVRIGDAELGHDHARGALAGDGHEVAWDLSWLPADRTLRQLPDRLYGTPIASSEVVSPNPDVPVRGTITVDGRTFVLDGDPGGQSHVWGRKHAHAWAWGHCNAFAGRRGAVLEALTARVARGPLVLPPLTVVTLRLGGEELAFRDLVHLATNRGRGVPGRYDFVARGRDARLVGTFRCRTEDLVLAPYEDPDGAGAFCRNSCAADLDLVVFRRQGLAFREAERLVARGTAHFETGSRSADPPVGFRHVAL